MSKLLAEIAIIAITVSSVFAQPALIGAPVLCGTATDCVTCGINSTVQNLFQIQNSPYCIVKSCSDDPGTNLNGWMCSSCESSNGFQAYGSGKIYFDPITSSCIASCSPGYHADSYNNCSPNGGASVGCGTASSAGNPSTDCAGCGANSTVQALFKPANSPNCQVINCALNPGANINGLMCKSCNGQFGAHAVYSSGKFLQGNTCASSCDSGFAPDKYNVCQSISGADVACGTASSANNPSTDCNGCGSNSTIQSLFKTSTSPNCKVADCSVDPGSNLNGWMCKSCNGATSAHTAYAAGKYFQGGACVASCTGGQVSDATNTCNAVISTSIAGKDVGCGTAGNAGGNSSNCNGCGASNTIQGLFTASGTPNCKLTDCSANPGSNLNGWMCKSCNGVAGAHSAYSAGNLFSGTTCVASCQPGQTADANNVCVSGTDSTNSSGSSFLTFAFVMLLLCLLL